MATSRRVYDSLHLQADCQEPGSAPEHYARQSSMGYLFLLTYLLTYYCSESSTVIYTSGDVNPLRQCYGIVAAAAAASFAGRNRLLISISCTALRCDDTRNLCSPGYLLIAVYICHSPSLALRLSVCSVCLRWWWRLASSLFVSMVFIARE